MQLVLAWWLDLGSGSLETAASHDGRRPHEGRPPAKGDTKPLQCTSGCTGKLELTEDGAINVAFCPGSQLCSLVVKFAHLPLWDAASKSAQYSALKFQKIVKRLHHASDSAPNIPDNSTLGLWLKERTRTQLPPPPPFPPIPTLHRVLA